MYGVRTGSKSHQCCSQTIKIRIKPLLIQSGDPVDHKFNFHIVPDFLIDKLKYGTKTNNTYFHINCWLPFYIQIMMMAHYFESPRTDR